MTAPTAVVHRIRWFVWASNGERTERIPHTSNMRGTWGYDAECTCGWATRTGGATRRYVKFEVWYHTHIEATD